MSKSEAGAGPLFGAVDLDPLAGAQMKGISHALLVAEPHPLEAGKAIIMVGTADGVVTAWEGDNPK